MISKVYEKVKKYIIDNHNFFLFLILLTIILNIQTPYVIKAPGGIMSLSDRVTVNDKNIKDTYYTSYVKVINGKLAAVLASYIIPNWDLEKYEEYSGNTNLTYDELNKVEKLMMNEGNNIAIVTALNKANIDYEITDKKLIVYYKHDGYKNDLKIGDVINKCDNNKISNIDELHDCVAKSNKKIDLNITRDNKEINMSVNTYALNGNKIIGISIMEDYKVKSKYDINITASESESGSSGGFMTALSIYSELTDLKLPKDIKIAGTGTIKDDEKIGKIEGIKYKLLGAEKKKVDVFFVPEENYKEALKIKKKHKLKIKIVKVSSMDDAINYLNKIKK